MTHFSSDEEWLSLLNEKESEEVIEEKLQEKTATKQVADALESTPEDTITLEPAEEYSEEPETLGTPITHREEDKTPDKTTSPEPQPIEKDFSAEKSEIYQTETREQSENLTIRESVQEQENDLFEYTSEEKPENSIDETQKKEKPKNMEGLFEFDPVYQNTTGDLFSLVEESTPHTSKQPNKTIHDIFNKKLSLDLNTKIAFAMHLFANSTDNLLKVVDHINSLESYEDAEAYIQKDIKPKYNQWEGKEHYEKHLMRLIKQKFS